MNTDWTSRILALASLIISLGAVAYQVSQDSLAKDDPSIKGQLSAQFDEELDKLLADYKQKQKDLEDHYLAALNEREKRFAEWNSSLGSTLSKFNTDAKELLDQVAQDELQASQERRTAFRQQLADLTGSDGQASSPDNAIGDAADSGVADADSGSSKAADAASAAGPDLQGPQPKGEKESDAVASTSPLLQLVNTVFRPTSADSMLITLRNDSDQEAIVQSIRFQPKKDFRAPQPAIPSEAATSGKLTTVRFSSEHNLSTRPGYHGLYSQKLASPIHVPAHGTATLRVLIEDAKTTGWGLAGRLFLDYNSSDQKPLQVNEAHVVFEAPSGSI